jgi:hypothetical protein
MKTRKLGDWWQSADLLSIFKGWGLFDDLYKADPNWPIPKRRGQVFEEGFPLREPNS